MSQVSYGTITITDTTDKTVYIAYASNALGENFSPNPSTNLQYVGINISTSTSMPSASDPNWVWSKYAGTDGVSITSVTEIYQLRNDSATPTKRQDGTALPAAVDTVNTWSLKVPPYITGGIYWTSTAVTMSAGTTPIYTTPVKDEGLTDANKNAQDAMSQAASNINSVIRLWYLTDTASPPNKPSTHVTQTSTSVTGQWTRNKPTVTNYRYYYYCDEICTGGGVYSWTDVVADTLSLTSYELGLINAKIKNHWWDSSGLHFASGINNAAVTTTNTSTYGYIGTLGLNGLTLGYNSYKTMELLTNALNFYQPPTIGSTTTQGNKTMSLTGNALRFYSPSDGTTEQAVLDANGLVLKKGGIESGIFGNGYVYLSTEDKTGITINGHTPGDSDPKWRQIIGSKFGVDSEGNLYASSAHISGPIRVTAGTNVYTTDNINPLEIGGRNLLLDSKSMESWSYGTDASLNSVDDFGEAVLVPIENNTWNAIISTRPTLNSSILNGNSMILSFEYTLSEDCTIAIGVDGTNEEPNTSSSITKTKYITKYYNLNTATVWNKFSAIMPTTIEELTLGSGEVNSFSISIANYLKANTIMKIRKVQLEYGNTATDWSPSPEDMGEDIVLAIQSLKDDTESELAAIRSEFDITADGIASQVSKKVGYDEIISVINQTAEEIKIEANKIDIEALTEQMTFSASNIVFGNTNVADSLNELNAAVSIDTETSTIYVGDRQGFHVCIDGSQLGFYQAGESDPVAYINNNQLYITQSVVLQQMDVGTSKLNNGDGQWSWKIHKNVNGENNLYLKWMG